MTPNVTPEYGPVGKGAAPTNGVAAPEILRVVLPYTLFAGLWILVSDGVLRALVPDPAAYSQWSTYKGWAFVLTTSVLLAALLRRELRARAFNQDALDAVNRLLRTLSECDQALVRARTEQQMLDRVCQIVVGRGGYRLAWIVIMGPDGPGHLQLVAQAGRLTDGGAVVASTDPDAEHTQEPIATALRTGQSEVLRPRTAGRRVKPSREDGQRPDDAAVLALPLKGDGCVLGVFALASGAPGAFGDNEKALLAQLARDLAFGITSLRERAERQRADAQVRQLHEELRRHAEELEQRVAERTRELAVARDRAEAADHLKSAFLATMSHELRTPLNSIIGFTGILLQGLAGPLNPEQTKQLGMVRVSARHLLELINDVLDISKIEAGQLEVRAECFDLAASARRVAAVVTPHAAKKGLVLTLTAPAGLPQMVSDRRRVEQILLNLLNNALKFTERGQVTLTAETVGDFQRSPALPPVPAVRLRVADTGIGIKPDDLALLFQPFRQLDTGLTRHHEGTGLGLAICRRLAGLLGGEIRAESEWGRGSTFTVSLPLSLEGESSLPPGN